MPAIRLAYVGGGSTRAPGTVAQLVFRGDAFDGSEVVLVDLDIERLEVVRRLAEAMARARGVSLAVSTTTDLRRGLADADVVLTSYRAGGFEARHLDESIPLRHGVIGQETQGPGGFFLALRSIHVMRGIIEAMDTACPDAWLVNYTNPVNIVAQAVADHTDRKIISLCEGPIIFRRELAEAAELDDDLVDAPLVGVNHGSVSTRMRYDGAPMLPLVERALERRAADPSLTTRQRRQLEMTVALGAIPADYLKYYLFRDALLDELRAKPLTRAQEILAGVPDYWRHYEEQACSDDPVLDPALSRGGVMELELAVDVIDAIVNDRGAIWPVNVPNQGAVPDLDAGVVVEGPAYVDRHGPAAIASGRLPGSARGLIHALAEYQLLAAEAAWGGSRRDAVRALLANPLVMTIDRAQALYDALAQAHRPYLPERLW
jgi:6-phospho-beta-glucosidase